MRNAGRSISMGDKVVDSVRYHDPREFLRLGVSSHRVRPNEGARREPSRRERAETKEGGRRRNDETTKRRNGDGSRNFANLATHLGVHVEGVQPPFWTERGQYPARVPPSTERSVDVRSVRIRRDERANRLGQHRGGVRSRGLVRAAHAKRPRLRHGDAEVPPAELDAVLRQRRIARVFRGERDEPRAFTPARGGMAQKANVAAEGSELREKFGDVALLGRVRKILDENLVPVAVVALRGSLRRGGIGDGGNGGDGGDGSPRRGRFAAEFLGTRRVARRRASETRGAAREVDRSARARPVVRARVVSRRASRGWHAERSRGGWRVPVRIEPGNPGKPRKPRGASVVAKVGFGAKVSRPEAVSGASAVALAAFLDDVFNLLDGRLDVASGDFADALLLSDAEDASRELFDLANLRPALADDATRLARALHLHHLAATAVATVAVDRGVVVGVVVGGGVARGRGGRDVLGAEVVARHPHEAPGELGLVEIRRRALRRRGVRHDGGGLAGENHHLGRVHAEKFGDLGGVRAGRDAAHAHARHRPVVGGAIPTAAVLLRALRGFALGPRRGVLRTVRVALRLLLLLRRRIAVAPLLPHRARETDRPARAPGCVPARVGASRRNLATRRACWLARSAP